MGFLPGVLAEGCDFLEVGLLLRAIPCREPHALDTGQEISAAAGRGAAGRLRAGSLRAATVAEGDLQTGRPHERRFVPARGTSGAQRHKIPQARRLKPKLAAFFRRQKEGSSYFNVRCYLRAM